MPLPSADLSLVVLVHVFQDYLHTHIKSRKVAASTVVADFSSKLASYEKAFQYPQKHQTPDSSALAQIVSNSELSKIVTFGRKSQRSWEFVASYEQIQAVLTNVVVDSAISLGGTLLEDTQNLKRQYGQIEAKPDNSAINQDEDIQPSETADVSQNDSDKPTSKEESEIQIQSISESGEDSGVVPCDSNDNSERDTISDDSTAAESSAKSTEITKPLSSDATKSGSRDDGDEEAEKESELEADSESALGAKTENDEGQNQIVDSVADDVEIEPEVDEDDQGEKNDEDGEKNAGQEIAEVEEPSKKHPHEEADSSVADASIGNSQKEITNSVTETQPASEVEEVALISEEEALSQDQIEEEEEDEEEEENEENEEVDNESSVDETVKVSETGHSHTATVGQNNEENVEETREKQPVDLSTAAYEETAARLQQKHTTKNLEDENEADSERDSSEEVNADDENYEGAAKTEESTDSAEIVEGQSIENSLKTEDAATVSADDATISDQTIKDEDEGLLSETIQQEPENLDTNYNQSGTAVYAHPSEMENASTMASAEGETPGAEGHTEGAGRQKRKLEAVDVKETGSGAKKPKTARQPPSQGRKKSSASDPEDKASLSSAQKYKKFQAIAVNLIKSIEAHRFSSPFLSAVTGQHYRKVVKHPKDLKTIMKAVKRKQDAAVYHSVKELKRDIFLMFTNCVMFNKSSAPLVEMAREMKEDARNMFKMFEDAEKLLNN